MNKETELIDRNGEVRAVADCEEVRDLPEIAETRLWCLDNECIHYDAGTGLGPYHCGLIRIILNEGHCVSRNSQCNAIGKDEIKNPIRKKE